MRTTVQGDPFEILGIGSSASEEMVVDAFRRLVRRNHPDAGGSGDMDRLVSARDRALATVRARVGGGSRTRQLFEGVLDGLGASSKGRHGGKDEFVGADIEAFVPVPREVLVSGGVVRFVRHCDCDACDGKDGTRVCRVCGGTGSKTVLSGVTSLDVRCKGCRGTGRIRAMEAACISPRGEPVLVSVPAGSEAGHVLVLPGHGMPGPTGRGDLVANLVMEPERRVPSGTPRRAEVQPGAAGGRYKVEIDLVEAACGARVQTLVPDVGLLQFVVPSGTQSGKILRFRKDGKTFDIVIGVRIPDASQEPLLSMMRRIGEVTGARRA